MEDISLASVSMFCHFRTLLLVSVLAQKSLAQCFTDVDCGGSTVPASSYEECCDGTDSGVSYSDGSNCTDCLLATRVSECYTNADCTGDQVAVTNQRQCCVWTNDGLSYSDGSSCIVCIVHGFEQADYDVREDERLETTFQLNVNGITQFGGALVINGTITFEADGTATNSDFELLEHIHFSNHTHFSNHIHFSNTAQIVLLMVSDEVTLEYDDRVHLGFIPDNASLIRELEDIGEFIRGSAIVNIIDNDSLEISFEGSDYSIEEGSMILSSPITLQFRTNQNPFTVTLSPVTVDTAEGMDLGFFINSGTIAQAFRATAGADFSYDEIVIEVPAGSQKFHIPQFFTIVDDNIDEPEQSFAIVAEIGDDVPENISCFKVMGGSTNCNGRHGATEIKINDRMLIGFAERIQTVLEGEAQPEEHISITVNVSTNRISEINYTVYFQYQDVISRAIVEPLSSNDSEYDALFGERLDSNGQIQELQEIRPGQNSTSIQLLIFNDLIPEEEECFTLRIQADDPSLRSLPKCNENGDSFFCAHMICIIDNDGMTAGVKQATDKPTDTAVVRVGYENTMYLIPEDKGYVEVCVNATSNGIDETFSIYVFPKDTSLVNSGIISNISRMFYIFVNSIIWSDTKCFNISANYNVGNLCSFFADCINRHLILKLEIRNRSHGTFVEGKNVAEIVIEIPNICLCEEEETPGINIAAIVVPSLLVIFTAVFTMAFILIMWFKKPRNTKKERETHHVLPLEHNHYTLGESWRLSLLEHLKPRLENKRMIYFKDQLELTTTVGQGESGLVYKGYIKTSVGKDLVAIKTGKALFSKFDSERLAKEIFTMLNFDHPNIMSLIGVCIDREMPLLIMPFMSKGSVLEYIRQKKKELSISCATNTLMGICYQISKGMEYLSLHRFVHRDLAARNCMIDRDGVIKVADFGLAEDMYGTNYFRRDREEEKEGKVPIRWMAPESIENDIYNEATDVWSFGVTMWEIFTCGSVPYAGIHVMKLASELRAGERLEKPENVACLDDIYEIMLSCWSLDPSDRPTFQNLAKSLEALLERESGYLKLSGSPKQKEQDSPSPLYPEADEQLQVGKENSVNS